MTLAADEFIRRFLIHVLPDSFHRIRYYGFLCNRQRQSKLARCRELISMIQAEPAVPADCRAVHRILDEALTNTRCPVCVLGTMLVVEVLPRQSNKRPWVCDTS